MTKRQAKIALVMESLTGCTDVTICRSHTEGRFIHPINRKEFFIWDIERAGNFDFYVNHGHKDDVANVAMAHINKLLKATK